jgi:integrase
MAKKERRKGRSKGTGSLFKREGRGPWIASWQDYDGRRRQRSTKTTDRAAAERILSKYVADAALRRDGVIDPTSDRMAQEGRKPLTEHIAAYIAHCRHVGQAPRHVDQKDDHLRRLIEGARVIRLGDLTADALERHLSRMRESGMSARSVNFARQIAVAFYSWCVKTGRAEVNPLRVVPKLDETRDRRRIRRPLTDDELARLLAVAREHGREAWYLAAALAGLRKGDLQRLTWADVDFEDGTITVRGGKAKRVDVVPMHPQLADALKRRKGERRAVGAAKVFPETVTDRTRLNDFLRAGIARREVVRDANGEPVMIGKGRWEREKTRIVVEDEEGRVIDLHALRTTLGTQLARAGVAPQIAQRIMRHGDYRTTLTHYTVLGLVDTSKAVGALPGIGAPQEGSERATGTADDAAGGGDGDPQRYPQRLGRETQRLGATERNEGRATGTDAADANPVKNGPYGPSEGKW